MPAGATRLVVLLIFFVSGAAGLAYEVVWTRQLGLVFGVTTYAVSTVLAVFMGGLALGSALFGRWVDRRPNPLRVYALLEIGIGLYALLVPFLFDALRPVWVWLRQAELSPTTLALSRAVLAACVLLPPTTLMGGTFPVLMRWWVRSRSDVGRGTGVLYLVNTAGALVGCFSAGFFLIEHLGLRNTTRAAAFVNVMAALAAGLLARPVPPLPESETREETTSGGVPASAVTLALLAAGISGFTSLAYEVVWNRALLRYLYSSTYAFTTMLTTFLGGIAAGSALYTLWLRRLSHPVLVLAVLQALVGVGFFVSLGVFPYVDNLLDALLGREMHRFLHQLLRMVLGAGMILLPPTMLLGASLPLATDLSVRSLTTIGGSVGRVYAVNTFGSILGSLGAGFLLIPTIGMHATLTLLIAINLALGLVLAAAGAPSQRSRLISASAIAVVAVLVLWRMPPDSFAKTLAKKSVYYREGVTDTVAVSEAYGQRSMLYDDRRGTAGTASYQANYFLGHLPVLLHPGKPEKVLHICFGVGNSLSAVASHDDVLEIDSVELSPHTVEASRYFWSNSDVLSDPRVHTIIDDGRNFLMASNETYDVITLEPPEPFTAGVINLFTRDFYQDASDHLASDGVMMAWIPTGRAPLWQERMLFRSFADVFPYTTAWMLIDSPTVLLIGTKQPLTIDYQRLRERMNAGRVKRDMELIGVRSVDHLLSFFVFDDATFRKFVDGVQPVTDDRTVLDFTMPRYVGSGFGTHAYMNDRVKVGLWRPMVVSDTRKQSYLELRASVLPYLRNLEGWDSPENLQARIDQTRYPEIKMKSIREKDWQR